MCEFFQCLRSKITNKAVSVQKINIPVKICFSPAFSAKPPIAAASLLPSQ